MSTKNDVNRETSKGAVKGASTADELVAVGVFTVIIAVINFLCNIIGVFGPQVQPFGAVLAVIIIGIPFALFIRRINHFGPVTVMATLLALIFTLFGHHLVSVLFALVFGLIADLIIRSGNYSDPKRTIVGYAFFGIYPMGNVLPLLFMRDDIIARYTQGANAEWARAFGEFLSTPMVLALTAICFVAALFGGWLGQWALRSYFFRAGL